MDEQISYGIIHCSCRKLVADDGMFCGFLLLNEPPIYSDIVSDNPLQGKVCELIAISEGPSQTSGQCRDIFGGYSPIFKGEKDLFNVLWIEWEDGIAYRKALGQVGKDAWNSQPEEWIDATLG
jgi:hypothetical protein